MATVSAQKNKTLYVLASENHYWLSTLATNRVECWAAAKPYCRTENWKKELRDDGYTCVAVRIEAIT